MIGVNNTNVEGTEKNIDTPCSYLNINSDTLVNVPQSQKNDSDDELHIKR
jgi:hypothetical protein